MNIVILEVNGKYESYKAESALEMTNVLTYCILKVFKQFNIDKVLEQHEYQLLQSALGNSDKLDILKYYSEKLPVLTDWNCNLKFSKLQIITNKRAK